MRIFVAGATGAVGRRLVPKLVSAGHEVTAIGRTPEKRASLARFGATPADVSLFDRDALFRAVAGHDAVINLATKIPPSPQAFLPWAWTENSRIRSEGAANLADAAVNTGAKRFVQESFAPIYDDAGDEWITETSPVRPAPHTRAALDAEAAAARFGERGTAVVLRFAFFYASDSAFTQDMIRYGRLGWAATFGSPDAYFSSVTHDDAAAATLAALDVPAGTYNVADCEPLRRREYHDALAAAFGLRPPRFAPSWIARLAGSIGDALSRSQRISSTKLRRASEWRPAVRSAREGWRMIATELRATDVEKAPNAVLAQTGGRVP